MKKVFDASGWILIVIFLMSGMTSHAQLSTNQFKQVTSMIKTSSDNLYKEINWLKMQRTNDLLRIAFLENLTAQQSVQVKANLDSIISIKKYMADSLTGNLKVDTNGVLRVYNNILFSKQIK